MCLLLQNTGQDISQTTIDALKDYHKDQKQMIDYSYDYLQIWDATNGIFKEISPLPFFFFSILLSTCKIVLSLSLLYNIYIYVYVSISISVSIAICTYLHGTPLRPTFLLFLLVHISIFIHIIYNINMYMYVYKQIDKYMYIYI